MYNYCKERSFGGGNKGFTAVVYENDLIKSDLVVCV